MTLSRLISFPDDFDPSQPAVTPNAPTSEPAGAPEFLPLLALVAADEAASAAPSVISSSTLSVETVLSHFDPSETGAGRDAPAPGVDPAVLAASTDPGGGPSTSGSMPVPPSSSTRSLSHQTSASFRAAAAVANTPARGRPAAQPAASAPAPRASSPSIADAYFHLGMTPAPSGMEPASAARTRHNENEIAIVNTIHCLEQMQQSQDRVARERYEEHTLMINGARISAVDDNRRLRETLHSDHAALSQLVGAVNDLRRGVADLRSANFTAGVAPLPALVDAAPVQVQRASAATMGPPASEATSSRIRNDPPLGDEDAPSAKRPRMQEGDHYDVWFYDVATTGEPRDIARAAMQAILHLTGGSFLNAIRVRGRPGTISIRFRTRPFALTFIDAIQNCPPPNFDGLHACWAPAATDPISIIRGDNYVARSTG
ncbi:hypothetical protein B0H10DRAFT_2233387 [Mycena sp. CBHHK59/15]|nr:hypothetical protein B0H10DRAFT_2233387 [Mycena sp. CBHHK59/15]